MNIKDIYHETSNRETAESADGHALDDIQVGQVCAKFMEVVKERTNGRLDFRKDLEDFNEDDIPDEGTESPNENTSEGMTYKNHNDIPDGIYMIAFSKDPGSMRCEKIDGKWFISDGTGWKEAFESHGLCPSKIFKIKEIGHLPKLKKDCIYKNTYPLTDFFPREEESYEHP